MSGSVCENISFGLAGSSILTQIAPSVLCLICFIFWYLCQIHTAHYSLNCGVNAYLASFECIYGKNVIKSVVFAEIEM